MDNDRRRGPLKYLESKCAADGFCLRSELCFASKVAPGVISFIRVFCARPANRSVLVRPASLLAFALVNVCVTAIFYSNPESVCVARVGFSVGCLCALLNFESVPEARSRRAPLHGCIFLAKATRNRKFPRKDLR